MESLTPCEYYEFTKTGVYPLAIPMPTEKVSPKKTVKKPPLQPAAETKLTETAASATVENLGGAAPGV